MTKKMDTVVKEIQHYFKILFTMGFHIVQVEELPMSDWRVTLTNKECAIVIATDRSEVDLTFSPVNSIMDYRVGLGTMIYYLSNGQIFMERVKLPYFNRLKNQLEKLANILSKYIDQIIPYFEEDYARYQQDLVLAGEKCLNLYIDKYIPKRKSRDRD